MLFKNHYGKCTKIIKRCLVLAMTGAVFCSSCGNGEGGKKVSTDLGESNLLGTEIKNPAKGYYKTDVWKAVPMAGEELEEGLAGGEGCQWPLYVTMDSTVGKLAFFGTDVGGIYRSTDGGVNWVPATIGMDSCGATGIAIDPNNINRVLCVGCNSGAFESNGLYLSENAGDTWTHVLSKKIGSYRDLRNQIAWDKSSKDDKIGGSKIAYWSREAKDDNKIGAEVHPALYKTEDGGKTWNELPDTADYAGCNIAVNPDNGDVYAANKEKGLFCSTDGGKTFKCILEGEVLSMDTVYTHPGYIFCTKKDALYYSVDGGKSFKSIAGTKYPKRNPTHLRVSPVNINHMILQDDRGGDQSSVLYTADGGATWKVTKRGNDEQYRWIKNCSIPYNARGNVFAWSPVDENALLSLGGDFIMRSTDGGKNLIWSNSGYTGMMTGGLFNFNVNHPEMMFNPSQDYNGFYTVDAGKTWKYIQWYMDWGGFTYGGYVINKDTVICGGDERQGKGLEIWTTFDGGKTINKTGNIIKGHANAMGVPGDDNTVFFGEWRTTDGGHTWSKMEGCSGVFTYDPETGDLYGADRSFIVKSTDKGATWTQISNVADKISDMAWEAKTKTLLVVVSGGGVFRSTTDKKITKLYGLPGGGFKSVCVDDKNSDIIYLAARNGTYQVKNSVVRSVDGGKTWTVLTRSVDDGRVGPDGAKEASCIRINKVTREVYVGTCCRGLWSMPIPDVK